MAGLIMKASCKGGAGFSLVELKVQDLNQFRTQISYRLGEETPPS